MKKTILFSLLGIVLLFTAISFPASCKNNTKNPDQNQEHFFGQTNENTPSQSPNQTDDTNEQTHDSEKTEKTICLTFDDGPTDSTTPKILDILKEEGVPATFFVVGRQIKNREQILRREAKEGHTIGIHTYSHQYGEIYASEKSLLCDIAQCKKAIQGVLPNYETDLYRFPGGTYTVRETLINAVTEAGYRWYDWNASTEDAVLANASAQQLYTNAITSAGEQNNVVLLMHDGVRYNATIQSLPDIISYFKEKGYQFKTL